MSEYMTPRQFAEKVDLEGSIIEALDYMNHTQLDPSDPEAAELRQAWASLERLWEPLKDEMAKVDRLLEEIYRPED